MEQTVDGFLFSSNFDSGNLRHVSCSTSSTSNSGIFEFDLKLCADCEGTVYESKYRAWFHFSIRGPRCTKGNIIQFTIHGVNNHAKLYSQGMRPCIKSIPSQPNWDHIKSECIFNNSGEDNQLTFRHAFEYDGIDEVTYFAFAQPFSYSECQAMLQQLDHRYLRMNQGNIHYHRELLTTSIEGRNIDLLTITSTKGINKKKREPLITGLFPHAKAESRPYCFSNKSTYFLSARVHPGETPSSHIFNGFLAFILDPDDPRAIMLRDMFVFKVVPMINPDGVFHGQYRNDTRGANLNRCYHDPNPSEHPAIYAIKHLLISLKETQNLEFYVDLHGHASKRGCFIFGNSLNEQFDQINNVLYPKLMSLNSQFFEFDACNFSEKNMSSKDSLGVSKSGTGRVATYQDTQLVNIYTMECNYNTNLSLNQISPISLPNCNHEKLCASLQYDINQKQLKSPVRYTEKILHSIGRALAVTLLDYKGCNLYSRLPSSQYKSLQGVTEHLRSLLSNRRRLGAKIERVSIFNRCATGQTLKGKQLEMAPVGSKVITRMVMDRAIVTKNQTKATKDADEKKRRKASPNIQTSTYLSGIN